MIGLDWSWFWLFSQNPPGLRCMHFENCNVSMPTHMLSYFQIFLRVCVGLRKNLGVSYFCLLLNVHDQALKRGYRQSPPPLSVNFKQKKLFYFFIFMGKTFTDKFLFVCYNNLIVYLNQLKFIRAANRKQNS